MPGEHEQNGLTRRELLKRGAVLGGALAWATPTIQVLGMRPAFAAATSPAISFVELLVTWDGDCYRIKWEDGGGWTEPPGKIFNGTGCEVDTTKAPCNGTFIKASGGFVTTNLVQSNDPDLNTPSSGCLQVTLRETVDLVDAVVKGGQFCDRLGDLTVQVSGQTITFCPPVD